MKKETANPPDGTTLAKPRWFIKRSRGVVLVVDIREGQGQEAVGIIHGLEGKLNGEGTG